MAGTGRLVLETSVSELDADAAAIHRLPPGSYVVLAVTDTGPGIDPEIQKRIFEPFFTTKEAGKGTGLGLSIAHGIIAQAGGSLDVYSERGHGTTFRVRLPSAREATVAEVPRLAPVVRPLRPATILFVEQDRELRSLVARVLAADGCTVLPAGTGAEARELCVTHDGAIDVAIVDVALADGRGDVLARGLRELRPKLGVLLVSGFPTASLRPSGEQSAPVLAKPFTPSQLRAAIASVQSDDPQQRVSEPLLQSRILVADDDPSLRRMLARLFRRAGFDVVDVDNGRDALTAISAKRFDVIVSDIHMPGGDGIELLRAVRRIDLDIPIILMSGKPDVKTAATALEFGAFRYLSKPLDGEAMEKVVRHAARAHALARIRREAMAIGGGDRAGTADRAGLEVRFESALEKLWMAFQPIIEAKSGALFGVEALMRTREPSLPSPPAMIDAATKLDRMPVLSRHVRNLSATALAARPDIPSLFVNLHPSDLLDATLIDESAPLTQIASRVVLEVTERESLDTTAALTERLERLRDLGFRIAVDDIGAGYSGLTSFTDLMPEIVKIDMSLVRSIHTNAIKQRTVAALCRLCHDMGTLVVGEGVETAAEQDVLVALGCDLLQGYLIAKPAAELPT
jgi:EAL domain-containing protein (putative c-di-GMP-specific phosphodiesterase class I)